MRNGNWGENIRGKRNVRNLNMERILIVTIMVENAVDKTHLACDRIPWQGLKNVDITVQNKP
jgi:hypothetical protein